VGNDTFTASYGYLANSALWGTLTFKQSGAARMTTTRQFDKLNRLLQVSAQPTGAPVSSAISYGYTYNDANRRTRATLTDGSYWVYQYDTLGQVISGKKYWSDGTPVAGQQFEYAFDDIGNRTSTKAGGDQAGANLRSATYTATTLNQYTNRTVPGAADVLGIAHPGATLSVNADSNVYRRGEYFRKELSINNASAAQYPLVSVVAGYQGTNTTDAGYVFVPQTPEVFAHDLDGNLIRDGRWTNVWDAENRLVEMVSLTNGPAASKRWLKFGYDWRGRRMGKTVCVWTNSAWSVVVSNKFLYDGWNLLAELNATNNTVIRSYAWGLDLSGTEQGAGGVGGLVAVKAAGAGVQWPAYDGNGNVMGMYDAVSTNWAARFEYGPFGEAMRANASAVNATPFRFSTKYTDAETESSYYGYRFYAPGTGRWLSRDPSGERGGATLQVFVFNAPVGLTDFLGLDTNQVLVAIFEKTTYKSGAEWGDMNKAADILQGISKCLEWRVAGVPLPGTPGKQKSNSYDGEEWKAVFFVDAEWSGSPVVAAGGVFGYGKNFEAFVSLQRALQKYDEGWVQGFVPLPWQRQQGEDAVFEISGSLMAHEIMHALGRSGHLKENDPKWLMSPDGSNRWRWLVSTPVLDDKSIAAAKKTLGVK
ncbi:MAG TPA: RHS repeat-associated core domain-containing protein, partial [Verrucomicrobiota bacterium]|nr:RHS repeat-associated core domain-containing protein [Verrucomicrobiota bacterium]